VEQTLKGSPFSGKQFQVQLLATEKMNALVLIWAMQHNFHYESEMIGTLSLPPPTILVFSNTTL
jgi:hypothetical protein